MFPPIPLLPCEIFQASALLILKLYSDAFSKILHSFFHRFSNYTAAAEAIQTLHLNLMKPSLIKADAIHKDESEYPEYFYLSSSELLSFHRQTEKALITLFR